MVPNEQKPTDRDGEEGILILLQQKPILRDKPRIKQV